MEEYLMFLTLVLYIASAGVQHVFLADDYTLFRVEKGLETPTSDFPGVMTRALRANGVIVILVSSPIPFDPMRIQESA